ncbi:MAG: matrixin family metalloprotease [Planctomycetota bacterium]
MKSASRRTSRKFLLQNDSLEPRCVPATFGMPWPNADRLTLSFAPDSLTTIRGQSSNLSNSLNTQFGAAGASASSVQSAWQTSILKAFEIWSSVANINFGVVADDGSAFGASGQVTSDSRFGDIRIGGIKLSPNALALSMPFDPAISGTNSGDMVFNTDANLNSNPDKLLRVALHEVGHVLGLDHSTDLLSVMTPLLNQQTTLAVSDITAIQNLYGVRNPDQFDAKKANDTVKDATSLSRYDNQNGQLPLVLFADVTQPTDVDNYMFQLPSNYTGYTTIRLQTGGLSLLNASVTVLDSSNVVVGQGEVNLGNGGVSLVQMSGLTPGSRYQVQVKSLDNSSFRVGAYGLAVNYDNTSLVSQAQLNDVLNGHYDSVDVNDLKKLLVNKAGTLLNNDQHKDDDPKNAVKLSPVSGFQANSLYTYTGSFSDSLDVDQFRISGSPKQASVVTLRVDSLDNSALNPTIILTDTNGKVVPSKILINNDHEMTIQAVGLKPSDNLAIQIQSGTGQVGNYRLEADFGNVASNLKTFVANQVSTATSTMSFKFYVAQPQIFQFTSAIQSQTNQAGSQLDWAIIDSTGQVVWNHTSTTGLPTSGDPVLLNSGEYRIFVRLVTNSGVADTLNFQLSGSIISDPIGPVPVDSIDFPQRTDPGLPILYSYPGGVIIDESFFIIPIPDPNYNPWANYGYGGWIA